jgi:hypothetical protein
VKYTSAKIPVDFFKPEKLQNGFYFYAKLHSFSKQIPTAGYYRKGRSNWMQKRMIYASGELSGVARVG